MRPVMHRLDIVAVGIEEEGRVITWMVIPLAGSAIVASARFEAGLMETAHCVMVWCLEGEMNAGRLAACRHRLDPELIAVEEAWTFDHPNILADRRYHSFVEALARFEVLGIEMNVIE